MAYLSRNEVWGEVERRRSGVREGEGRAWEEARVTLVWLQMLHLPVK